MDDRELIPSIPDSLIPVNREPSPIKYVAYILLLVDISPNTCIFPSVYISPSIVIFPLTSIFEIFLILQYPISTSCMAIYVAQFIS